MPSDSQRVAIQENVLIDTVDGRELRYDIFTPPGAPRNAPGVLLVHGGGWSQGEPAQLRGYGIFLGRLGYVCVSAAYRLSGEAKWPAQIHDVKAALRWMRANAGSLGVDPDRIAIHGNSAGAHLALMVAATPADYEAASPVTYARKDFPPTMLIHGTKDELVPWRASLQMYEALDRAGAEAELHLYNGLPHAFDANSAYSRISDLIHLFLQRNMPAPGTAVAAAG